MIRFLLLLSALFVSACSQGFDRGRLQQEFANVPLQTTDIQVTQAQKLRPQLKFPFRLAVALTPPMGHGREWRWTADDKEKLNKWGAELVTAGLVKDASIMSDMFVSNYTIEELRRAGAQHGADAVLVIRGNADIDSYANLGALLYLTGVGAAIVPGTHRDALFVVQGGLIDVNNGFLYASAEAEGENDTVRPLFFTDTEEAIKPAKETAFTAFGSEMVRRLRNLR